MNEHTEKVELADAEVDAIAEQFTKRSTKGAIAVLGAVCVVALWASVTYLLLGSVNEFVSNYYNIPITFFLP